MAIALVSVGFLLATTIAVVEFVQLRAAEERIAELEARAADEDDGGLVEGFGDLLDELLGEGPAGGLADGLSTLGCAGALEPGVAGEAGRTIPAIARQVGEIRDLEFDEVPRPTFLSSIETARRVEELFLEEYTPDIAEVEERVLTALGAIPAGTDLRQVRARALGGQVAGFYEPETGELVVRQAGGDIATVDRITLAHELDHALTDQALGIPLPDDLELGAEDANLAALALVEGDATLVMQRYSARLGLEEQLELLDPAALADAEAGLRGLPDYVRREMLFPYRAGLEFVCDLYDDGGWDAVNQAYADPPTSTAQILFPDRYDEDEAPADPRDPSPPGRGWRQVAELQLGAANLLWLFEAPGGDASAALEDPTAGAGAWAGGELGVWARGRDTAVGISLAERPGTDALCSAMSDWYAAAFPDAEAAGTATARGLVLDGERQDAALTCSDHAVRLGIAPDAATAGAVAA